MSGFTLDLGVWSTYTPTVTSTGGTITTVTSTGRYKLIGKIAFVLVTYNITSLGTATGDINLTFPPGITSNGTNIAGNGYITSTDVACVVKISTIPSLQFVAGATAQGRSATFIFETT
ncbi:MAG: hypothetical protein LC750_00505 [Actinobacteria bacterium]|nr:hypothetical protein [Actinomycetota bacterium]